MTIKITIYSDVNPEHIDCYGHLNNSKIPEYVEKGRLRLQEESGLADSELSERGIGLLVHKSYFHYKRQIFSDDHLTITSSFGEYNGRLILPMNHEITVNDRLAVKATTEHCFYDFNKKKPIRPIDEFLKLISSNR
jgi:YbgC/YbaW family acyl-CoA thioester hydrolase